MNNSKIDWVKDYSTGIRTQKQYDIYHLATLVYFDTYFPRIKRQYCVSRLIDTELLEEHPELIEKYKEDAHYAMNRALGPIFKSIRRHYGKI
jgi:hypothetical protein